MADQATYILMGAYIGLFAVLFVCVFGAIIAMGREQTPSERPAVAAMDQRPPVRTPIVMADTAASGAPTMARTFPTRPRPAS